jgi:hypothetical protein
MVLAVSKLFRVDKLFCIFICRLLFCTSAYFSLYLFTSQRVFDPIRVMEFEDLEPLLGYLLVAICWGVTNPFIKRETERDARDREAGVGTKIMIHKERSMLATLHMLLRTRILIPFLINQSGSLVNACSVLYEL